MKSAVSVDAGATLMVLVTLAELEPLATVNRTPYEPAAAKTWLGWRVVLVDPSLKSHCQEAGVPVEVSVNWTACPATGEGGVKVNEAVSAGATVSVRLVLAEPDVLATVRVTV